MTAKNFIKSSTFSYTLLAIVLFLLAGGLVLLPKYQKQQGIKPEELLSKTVSPERYISTDEVASIIINQDPSYLLIDVRDEASYANYTLPNAINIPLNTLLEEDSVLFLNQNQYDVILFSNDEFYANEAWILCNRLNFKNLRVLEGGLNKWFNTIINPKKPIETMPETAFELYDTRKAASMYFGVVYPEQANNQSANMLNNAPKKVITVQKKKKAAAEGCC
jgi:rhodanese-related sulfurtransferase